ncbi:MAG: transcription termination/antitermination protein NusG [Acidobacteriota bacterium]
MAKQWYVVHTYSGYEKKVAESLKQRAKAFGRTDQIGEILIPTENVVEIRGGRKVVSSKRVCPGYILVEMDMNDETWRTVKETAKVTGFVGSGQWPTPLSDDEVGRIKNQATTAQDKPKMKHLFERGEAVRIVDGPFSNFNGVVEQVNPERNTVKVMVPIFGRDIPVELDFLQVEKMN